MRPLLACWAALSPLGCKTARLRLSNALKRAAVPTSRIRRAHATHGPARDHQSRPRRRSSSVFVAGKQPGESGEPSADRLAKADMGSGGGEPPARPSIEAKYDTRTRQAMRYEALGLNYRHATAVRVRMHRNF